MRNGARHQLFPGARRARNKRREIAHARVKRATVAAHVVRKNGLPDCGSQPRRRHRAADNVAEDLLEGALDLAKARESVCWVVSSGKVHVLQQEVPPVRQEVAIENPPRAPVFGRFLAEARLQKLWIVAIVEKLYDAVFIQQQILFAEILTGKQSRAQLFRQRFQAARNPPDVRPRTFRVFHWLAPHGFTLDVVVSKRRPLELRAFG